MPLIQLVAGSAAQPAPARSFTSLTEVAEWLGTLPDVQGSVEMQKIKTALAMIENLNRDSLRSICQAWGQDQRRKQKNLTPEVIAEELTAKVLAASNAALRRWENSGGAAQPAAPSDAAHPAHDDEISHAEPAAPSSAAQPAHDDDASVKFTSVREVEDWLASLQDIAENEELRKIQKGVEFVIKPSQNLVENICAAWPEQNQKRNGLKMMLPT